MPIPWRTWWTASRRRPWSAHPRRLPLRSPRRPTQPNPQGARERTAPRGGRGSGGQGPPCAPPARPHSGRRLHSQPAALAWPPRRCASPLGTLAGLPTVPDPRGFQCESAPERPLSCPTVEAQDRAVPDTKEPTPSCSRPPKAAAPDLRRGPTLRPSGPIYGAAAEKGPRNARPQTAGLLLKAPHRGPDAGKERRVLAAADGRGPPIAAVGPQFPHRGG